MAVSVYGPAVAAAVSGWKDTITIITYCSESHINDISGINYLIILHCCCDSQPHFISHPSMISSGWFWDMVLSYRDPFRHEWYWYFKTYKVCILSVHSYDDDGMLLWLPIHIREARRVGHRFEFNILFEMNKQTTTEQSVTDFNKIKTIQMFLRGFNCWEHNSPLLLHPPTFYTDLHFINLNFLRLKWEKSISFMNEF